MCCLNGTAMVSHGSSGIAWKADAQVGRLFARAEATLLGRVKPLLRGTVSSPLSMISI